jgi:hypothetical protein
MNAAATSWWCQGSKPAAADGGGVGAQMGGDTKLQASRDRDGPAHQEPILLLIIYSQITFFK